VWHVACIGAMRNHVKFLSEYLKGRDYSKDLVIDGKRILEWILEK